MGCTCEKHHEHEHHEHHDHNHHDHGHTHACGCGCCGHAHEAEENEGRRLLLRLLISGALLALGLFLPVQALRLPLLLLSLLAAGLPVFIQAFRHLLRGQMLDEMFLMTVASIGAFCLGEYFESVMVLLLYTIGEYFQDQAVDKSRKSIVQVMDLRPETARVERNGEWAAVSPQEVALGEILLVRPGERIPLDGVVMEGESALDTVALTGESLPREVQAGEKVVSGCLNLQKALKIQVTSTHENSTVSRILEMAENAAARKSRADQLITRFARVYTPLVVGAALLAALLPPLLMGGDWQQWIHTALTFLVISCPCALVISVPLTYFSGIGAASRRGVLVKGANDLEALARAGIAVFDKTGTLTEGKFSVIGVYPDGNIIEEKALLSLAAAAEGWSNHPIAQSLREKCAGESLPSLTAAEEIPGLGVIASVDGRRVLAGNEKLMEREKIAFRAAAQPGTCLYLAADGEYLGCILLGDLPKAGAKDALKAMKRMGAEKIVMLTGDREDAARVAAGELGIDCWHAGLLPDGKVAQVEALMREKKGRETLIFVGDGVNDAPVLARADAGVAMGALGSDAAIEAADVVLMDDDLGKLPKAIAVARKTQRIVWQNIAFSLGVKALVMIAGVLGTLPLWLAVFADVGVCLLAILNAMRNR